MTPTLLAAVLGLSLGQVQWVAGLQGESRALKAGAGDLLVDPRVGLEYGNRELLLQAGYDPALTFREPTERGSFNALHRASAIGSLRLSRDTRMSVNQSFRVGAADLSWLASSFDSPPSFAVRSPSAPAVDTFDETTAAVLEHLLTRQVLLNGNASYSIMGGSDPTAQADLPRTRSLRLAGGGAWVERQDSVGLTAAWTRASASNGSLSRAYEGGLTWRHAFSPESQRALTGEPLRRLRERAGPRYETELGAGLAVVNREAGTRDVVPTAAVTLRRDEPVRRAGAVGGHVTVRYAPVLDNVSGSLAPRGEVSAALDVRLARQLVAVAGGGVAKAISGNVNPTAFAQGGAMLVYEIVEDLTISAGGRVARIPDTEWAGILGMSWSYGGRL